MMGIRRLKSGMYQVTIQRRSDIPGWAKPRKKKSFRLRIEAERWLASVRNKILTGVPVEEEKKKVEDVYNLWLDFVKQNNAPKYWVRCCASWKPLQWLTANGAAYVNWLNLKILDKYREQRRAAGLSGQTIHNECRSLVACLNWARSRSLVPDNPLSAYKVSGKIDHKVPEVPTPQDLQKIFDHLKDEDMRRAFYGLLALGCRVSAFRELRTEHITATKMLHFVAGVKGKQTYRRTLPEFPFALPPKGFLFTNAGEQWSEHILLKRLHKACKDAGVAQINVHTCRHAVVTFLLAGGTPSSTVMGMTGHRSLSMIERYLDRSKEYGALLDKNRRDGYLPIFRPQE